MVKKKQQKNFVGIVVGIVVLCLALVIVFNIKPVKDNSTHTTISTCIANYDSLTMQCDCDVVLESEHHKYSNTLSLPDKGCGSVCDSLCEEYAKSLTDK